eukprot:3138835-Prymnesium_polylepis.8
MPSLAPSTSCTTNARSTLVQCSHAGHRMQADEPLLSPTDYERIQIYLNEAGRAWEAAANAHLSHVTDGDGHERIWCACRWCVPPCSAKLVNVSCCEWCQSWDVEAKPVDNPANRGASLATQHPSDERCWRYGVGARQKEYFRQSARGVEPCSSDDKLQQEHREPQKQEEDEATLARIAQSIGGTHFRRHFAQLDQHHAQVDKYKRKFEERHKHSVLVPLERLER